MKNIITAVYLRNIIKKHKADEDAKMTAEVREFVDGLLKQAEYNAKTYGDHIFKFNRSSIPYGQDGRVMARTILQKRGFKTYADKRNSAQLVIEW